MKTRLGKHIRDLPGTMPAFQTPAIQEQKLIWQRNRNLSLTDTSCARIATAVNGQQF
jgi:hypothetical protein